MNMRGTLFLANYATSITQNFQDISFVVEFCMSSFLIILLTGILAYAINRLPVRIFYLIADIGYVLAFAFGMEILAIIIAVLIIGASVIVCFVNLGLIRTYIAIPLKNSKSVSKAESKVYNKEEFISNVCKAVKWLSKTKTGALITIERKTPMDDYIQNGTILNAPFVPELVETIFFDKTRLHDGAIVVKNGIIIAAAVMYDNSTDEYEGKLGARHRAAIGISKLTDSVTVVVSEETGQISIAHSGILDKIKSDEFEMIFRNQIEAN